MLVVSTPAKNCASAGPSKPALDRWIAGLHDAIDTGSKYTVSGVYSSSALCGRWVL
jgi:hypothetical protein